MLSRLRKLSGPGLVTDPLGPGHDSKLQRGNLSPLSSLDDFSGLESDTAIPTEEAYVIYDEGTNWF